MTVRRILMRDIVAEVATKHRLRATSIIGPRRFRRIVHARQEAMYRCRVEAGRSYPEIAAAIGNRHHTTVLHGVRAHAARIGAPIP